MSDKISDRDLFEYGLWTGSSPDGLHMHKLELRNRVRMRAGTFGSTGKVSPRQVTGTAFEYRAYDETLVPLETGPPNDGRDPRDEVLEVFPTNPNLPRFSPFPGEAEANPLPITVGKVRKMRPQPRARMDADRSVYVGMTGTMSSRDMKFITGQGTEPAVEFNPYEETYAPPQEVYYDESVPTEEIQPRQPESSEYYDESIPPEGEYYPQEEQSTEYYYQEPLIEETYDPREAPPQSSESYPGERTAPPQAYVDDVPEMQSPPPAAAPPPAPSMPKMPGMMPGMKPVRPPRFRGGRGPGIPGFMPEVLRPTRAVPAWPGMRTPTPAPTALPPSAPPAPPSGGRPPKAPKERKQPRGRGKEGIWTAGRILRLHPTYTGRI